MHQCPVCRHARWVYPRSIPFADVVRSITGWSPHECLSCGWIGWRPARRSRPHDGEGPEPEPTPPLGTSQLLREQIQRGVLPIGERARAAVGRIGTTVPAAVRRAPKRSMVAFAIVLLIGVLLFAGGISPDDPATQHAVNRPLPLDPAPPARPAGPVVTAAQAVLPAVERGSTPAPNDAAIPAATSGRHGADGPDSRAARMTADAAATPSSPGRSKPATRSPAARLPPYRGSLAIDSDPPGAHVSVDGRAVGRTPVVLDDLPAGSCVVRVESDGYELWSAAARVVANTKTKVVANLQPGSHQ